MNETDVRHAICGAFMFGYQGNNKPPSEDHWLMEWWNRGQAAAKLEKALLDIRSVVKKNEWSPAMEKIGEIVDDAVENGS